MFSATSGRKRKPHENKKQESEMFKSRNDKEALSSAMDEYIRDHAPVSCDDLVRAMEEQGFHHKASGSPRALARG